MNKKTDESFDSLENVERFQIARGVIDISPGIFVRYGDRTYRINEIVDRNTIIGLDVESGRSNVLPILGLRRFEEDTAPCKDIEEITGDNWQEAKRRYEAITPFIGRSRIGRQEVDEQAKIYGVNVATLYRWINRFESTGSMTSLISHKRGWREGRGRIPAFAEEVIREVIETYYLKPQRPTVQKAVEEVIKRCNWRGITPPSPGTIRSRISKVPEKDRLRNRGQKEKAKKQFQPTPGHFPGADYPLSVIQIDHTRADIILVDDNCRKPIGRPWLTLAIDVYSRMITGFYLSLDPPSETSVAMCVVHSILPKDEWLLLNNVNAEWPVFGIPCKVLVDNAAEFRSDTFQRSCLSYGINVEYRPVKVPHYGGHIERVIGTFMKEIHNLPGTTFSSVNEKGEYNAEKHASMTRRELEIWLINFICNVYHKRIHRSLGIPPIKMWNNGIYGDADIKGTGHIKIPKNRFTVLLDFLPSFRRTVQTTGITIDGLAYYAEVLRPWINEADPERPNKKREHIFRRDPRDISVIWFYEPNSNEYFKIPYADQSLPPMSLWEFQQVKKKIREDGSSSFSASEIMHALDDMRRHVEKSIESTKKARRQAQRRKDHIKHSSQVMPVEQPPSSIQSNVAPTSQFTDDELEFIGDIA